MSFRLKHFPGYPCDATYLPFSTEFEEMPKNEFLTMAEARRAAANFVGLYYGGELSPVSSGYCFEDDTYWVRDAGKRWRYTRIVIEETL